MYSKNCSLQNNFLDIKYTRSDIISSTEKFNMHLHDFYEIYYFLEGDVTYYIEGHGYQMEANSLLIINNKELHKPIFNKELPYERIVIHFFPWVLSKYDSYDFNLLECFENRKEAHHNKIIDKNKEIFNYFKKITQYVQNKSLESELMVETLFIQMLVLINKKFNKKTVENNNFIKYNRRILEIITYINSNIEKSLSLNLLAEEFYLNKSYLSHIFKKNTGFSVLQYIHYKKIMTAKRLLLDNNSCSEVSSKLNFGDYSTFYRSFKREVGISPQEYQKQRSAIEKYQFFND
ncbi:AraC-like DNA-binding protein [Halanaerobium saccharolyticum]|uniref:AraC-like DNA-binding protein n=1 Tax=Halanaerobium saccharolyticum TaxID=43595 RepID=A0A4R7Z5H4_9FIRM|nr:AraC family transcriptional regulator [Halanaerobium saccharolyticum]RAK12444.1 AraC-like DNA-binding protein [Halanaerobium saccharolyticum]TDW06370.1 AraC-like DNA-binding protein [Halanaerobium saccharolyticum]TDX61618.1 AraC-like DNA-binding protein [Halanaerobium saccharolyticum]